MDRFDPFVKYADVYGDIINWENDPMNKPQNQNKYFFSDGKTYYEQICKMLRLMSVFKEAFNQIYSNEDEISEAWENFVNNLSASVVEGSEPDVTLTWTDDSVNFEFTMVPGVPGEQGVGITSISFNSDYTMTITLSDGNSYTSMSLKGETGPQGPQGDTGSGLQILDVYATLADLQSAHPTGQPGDAYQVGSGGNYILYIWSSSQSAWVQAGTLGTVSPYTSAPLMDGTASAGSQNLYARGDHVHPSDTSRASKEELDALIKTSQALIDQSFTYRESPAIQDGLARINKIKGNTLVWNQLVQNGNFESTSGWKSANTSYGTISVSGNILTYTVASQQEGPYNYRVQQQTDNNLSIPIGHKVYIAIDFNPSQANNGAVCLQTGVGALNEAVLNFSGTEVNKWTHLSTIYTIRNASQYIALWLRLNNPQTVGATFQFRNFMIIDLTVMFGIGNEPTTVEEFANLFPLHYYAYDSGSLLNFNGTGIKTTGKNLVSSYQSNLGVNQYGVALYCEADMKPNTTYSISFVGQSGLSVYPNESMFTSQSWITMNGQRQSVTLTTRNDISNQHTENGWSIFKKASGSSISFDTAFVDVQIEVGSSASSYEPYEEHTLSLPISTYFPTGMKSTGSVYDELLPTKAITRVGAVDLGTLTWTYQSNYQRFLASNALTNDAKLPANNTALANLLCSLYATVTGNDTANPIYNKSIALSTAGSLTIRDESYGNDATSLKQALSGVYLFYELATPVETAVDLDLDFMAYEDGTEQLLPVNGSVPSTSPIIADMTYMSIDDAMEYVLEKLANVPQNTQQILDALEDDVDDLQTDVGALQTSVSGLQTSVGNINTNIGQLSSTVAGHTASISDMQSDITDLNTDLGDLSDTVTDHTSRIGTLESGLSDTNEDVQDLSTSVSGLGSTVTAQGETVTALDSIIQDISNNPVVASLGSHELGFVAAYVSATLAANTGTKVTIPKPTIFPNNYTPLFIVGMTTGSYNVSICEIPYSFGNRDSVDCRVWNHGGQQTTQITVYILCMRQKQSQ